MVWSLRPTPVGSLPPSNNREVFMAATALTVTSLDRSGAVVRGVGVAVDNVNGNSFPAGPNTWLELIGATATDTLTFAIPGSVDGQTISGKAIPVTLTADLLLGPWPP